MPETAKNFHVPATERGKYAGLEGVDPRGFLPTIGMSPEVGLDLHAQTIIHLMDWLQNSQELAELGLAATYLETLEKTAYQLAIDSQNNRAAHIAAEAFGEVEGRGPETLPLWVVYYALQHNIVESEHRAAEKSLSIQELILALLELIELRIKAIETQLEVLAKDNETIVYASQEVRRNQGMTYYELAEVGEAVQDAHQEQIEDNTIEQTQMKQELVAMRDLRRQLISCFSAAVSFSIN